MYLDEVIVAVFDHVAAGVELRHKAFKHFPSPALLHQWSESAHHRGEDVGVVAQLPCGRREALHPAKVAARWQEAKAHLLRVVVGKANDNGLDPPDEVSIIPRTAGHTITPSLGHAKTITLNQYR